MSQISNDWLEALKPEFAKPYYMDLYKFVDSEYRKGVVYPPSEDIFNAFNFTPLKNVKVLILVRTHTTMNCRHTDLAFRFSLNRRTFPIAPEYISGASR